MSTCIRTSVATQMQLLAPGRRVRWRGAHQLVSVRFAVVGALARHLEKQIVLNCTSTLIASCATAAANASVTSVLREAQYSVMMQHSLRYPMAQPGSLPGAMSQPPPKPSQAGQAGPYRLSVTDVPSYLSSEEFRAQFSQVSGVLAAAVIKDEAGCACHLEAVTFQTISCLPWRTQMRASFAEQQVLLVLWLRSALDLSSSCAMLDRLY